MKYEITLQVDVQGNYSKDFINLQTAILFDKCSTINVLNIKTRKL